MKQFATGNDGEWASITFNGTNGWVHTDYIAPVSKSNCTTSNAIKLHHPSHLPFRLMLSMSERMQILSSKRIGLINQGESFDVKEVNGNWVRISLK